MIWSSAAFSRSGFAPEPPLKQTFGADRASSLALSGWFALLADVGLPKTAQRVNEGASSADCCMVPQRYPMAQDHLVALKTSFYSHWGVMDLGGRFPVTAATSPFSRDGMAVKRGRCPISVTKAFGLKKCSVLVCIAWTALAFAKGIVRWSTFGRWALGRFGQSEGSISTTNGFSKTSATNA